MGSLPLPKTPAHSHLPSSRHFAQALTRGGSFSSNLPELSLSSSQPASSLCCPVSAPGSRDCLPPCPHCPRQGGTCQAYSPSVLRRKLTQVGDLQGLPWIPCQALPVPLALCPAPLSLHRELELNPGSVSWLGSELCLCCSHVGPCSS